MGDARDGDGQGVARLISRYFGGVDVIDRDTGLGLPPRSTSEDRERLRSVRFRFKSVAADCDFIHYECHGIHDTDWGCCYRCLQMVLANAFRESDSFALPSIEDIQRQLVVLGRQTPDKVGTSTWIEPPDCAAVLRGAYGVGADERVLHHIGRENNARGDYGIADLTEFWRLLCDHFGDGGPCRPACVTTSRLPMSSRVLPRLTM